MTSVHAVEFYDDDSVLIDHLADYVLEGRRRGEKTVVVATPEHREALSRRFDEGPDAFVGLDAAGTLEQFMIGGQPDPVLFEQTVGAVLREHAEEGVRAYGEMVSLLWAEDNVEATSRLEDLWNGLQREVAFPLLCSYPVSGFPEGEGMAAVCDLHTHVGLPREEDEDAGRRSA